MLGKILSWARLSASAVYAAAAVVTATTTALSLELWRADLRVPFLYRGDALSTGAHFKTVLEQGWYEYQPMLGAPLGQTYHDFPTADNLHMLAPYLFRLFTSDWAVAINLYFLLGFILSAITAVWFLRVCRVPRAFTIVLATLFALAPYHFLRGESHLWLASYYAIPLALGLLVMVFRGDRVWGRRESRSAIAGWLTGPSARTVLFLVILGSSSSYYSVFFIALLSFTGIIVLVRDRSWRAFFGAVALGGVTVVVMLANMFPDILYSWQNGANPSGLQRSRGETEFLALKFVQLILPWPGHRIDILAELRQQYDNAYLSLGEQPALGLIGAIGFLASFVIIVLLIGARKRFTEGSPRVELLGGLSIMVLFAFMCATVGGFSTVVSFVTSSLRGWNRMSIVIAMLSLAIVGLLLDLVIRRFRENHSSRATAFIAGGLAAAILVVGFFDQTPDNIGDGYAETKQRFESDDAYFSALEERLDTGDSVLLLPYIPFPENSGATGVLASDQLVPYLHSTSLRWSNGGIKGRPTADWPGELSNYDDDDLATLASSAEFDGIMIDRAASLDRGAAVEETLTAQLGEDAYVSPDGRFAFFDLRDYSEDLAASTSVAELANIAALVTSPVVIYPTPDFNASYAEDLSPQFETTHSNSAFSITNARDHTRTVHVEFTVTSPVSDGYVSATWPDGTITKETSTGFTASFSRTLSVASGTFPVVVSAVDLNEAPLDSLLVSGIGLTEKGITTFLADHH